MKRFYFKYFIIINLLSLLAFFVFFSFLIHRQDIGSDLNTVEKIKKNGVLRLITNSSINTYYYYNGQPAGFEYDLAKEFADFLNVDLDIITPGWNNMFSYLDDKKGDFIAAGLTITRERLEKAIFSIPYMTIQQHIVHHKLTHGPRSIKSMNDRTLHVRRGTSYHSRIRTLIKSGIDLNYVLHNNIPTLELIRMVNDKELKFTVSDSNIAFLSQRYYPDIRVGIPLQGKESLAWAARKDDSEMLKTINQFILYAMQTGKLTQLTDKYYANIENSDLFDIKLFQQRIRTRLPQFKDTIIKESEKYGFDWRLVAAVVYQESHFNPMAKSFTNVLGLMQVTTVTADEMGIENRLNPEQSIQAGIGYLDKMMKNFEHFDNEYEKTVFALASYNIGYGHITDAMKIARNKGLDDTKWQNLVKVLPLLSKSDYYEKTKYGYARGWEPVIYVEKIMTYFDILKQKEMKF
ncbi:MAG: membrane-bound lytic murein transglycosylase MltF [Proteobacteria bacterium]|nr:membrane-bound lytic murein transglycosylase MltF [Pseudomonadota bacterium]MBU1389857.1 membrane-bound lytic murein transglycosylase MltF [Pseudomonadota bacterium]MBU1543866.1 membrane-bound lytic murein transglycosylase MltF [Pseudomonadota bacterium]MBU2481097.1 membrane-bound lytic murein transglycosylase MltF [Pseudomonadota bacterium]